MKERRARQMAAFLRGKWSVAFHHRGDDFYVSVLGMEGQDAAIRNSIPHWFWLVFGVTSQTFKCGEKLISVSFEAKR